MKENMVTAFEHGTCKRGFRSSLRAEVVEANDKICHKVRSAINK